MTFKQTTLGYDGILSSRRRHDLFALHHTTKMEIGGFVKQTHILIFL